MAVFDLVTFKIVSLNAIKRKNFLTFETIYYIFKKELFLINTLIN